MQAIILAGGKGTRLKPFTTNFPKPLVPIGDLPILEIVLRQLKHAGFTRVVLAVNHLSELLVAFFGRGERLGLEISYSFEDKVLGTAGPLGLVESLDENFLVMNGDLLTTIAYADLFTSHCNSGAEATIATYRKDVKIDLGVLEIKGDQFENYIEKPTYNFDVSMGIYALSRSVLDLIPYNSAYDMPQLMLALHRAGRAVKCYRGDYYWLDIGRVDDYETASEIFEERRGEFLPE